VLENDKSSYLLTEEVVKDLKNQRRTINENNLSALENLGVYIIDELDGSSSFLTGHYEWGISVGYVKGLEHIAGAVYSPRIGGGTMFSASKDSGAFIRIGGGKERISVQKRRLEDSYVIVGVDCFLSKYPKHNKFVTAIADKARTTNSNGSCALALGLVATRMADVLIQPLQSPWDWAAGKCILEEAGGEMIFYEINNGEIKVIDKLQTKHYNPKKRMVGFVAGNREITNEVMNMLLKTN
jgi:myo-inositol-1(or 4)-monophosphatase